MAWISVHESLLGSKLRSLSKEIGCSQNEAIGLLIRLWLWGLKNADKNGMVIDADEDDIAAALTVGVSEHVSTKQAVEAMIHCEWLDRYEGHLFIHDWEGWQKYWYKYQNTLVRDSRRKRQRKLEVEDAEPEAEMDVSVTENKPDIPVSEESPPKKNKEPYTPAFEEFWKAYPRHKGKGEAYTKFKARLNDGWEPDALITAARKYADECMKRHTEECYIKHAKTFLSDSTPFTDYLPPGAFGTECSQTAAPVTAVDDDDPYADWR